MSNLKIDSDIVADIYRWTKGNPRLTFDICSDIEEKILQGNTITTDLLKDIIHNKYLVTYDVAPVDHIRDLISQDKNARMGLLSLLRNRVDSLSDEIKKRLYLY